MSVREEKCACCGYVGLVESVFYMDRGVNNLRMDSRRKARIEYNRAQPKVFICDVCYMEKVK